MVDLDRPWLQAEVAVARWVEAVGSLAFPLSAEGVGVAERPALLEVVQARQRPQQPLPEVVKAITLGISQI